MPDRARIAWRCRRGTRELDLLLHNYLTRFFDGAAPAEQRLFLGLLELPDDRLQRILFSPGCGGEPELDLLVAKIRSPFSL